MLPPMVTRLKYTPQATPAAHPKMTLLSTGSMAKLMNETNGQIMRPLRYIPKES